ncbi:hypothetical protein SPHINGOT1_60003 [Sphingomonas sp. T1]|nr:hypothetical protein SPHINGOT1_60003 [Sphingomonas sp. T1]
MSVPSRVLMKGMSISGVVAKVLTSTVRAIGRSNSGVRAIPLAALRARYGVRGEIDADEVPGEDGGAAAGAGQLYARRSADAEPRRRHARCRARHCDRARCVDCVSRPVRRDVVRARPGLRGLSGAA